MIPLSPSHVRITALAETPGSFCSLPPPAVRPNRDRLGECFASHATTCLLYRMTEWLPPLGVSRAVTSLLKIQLEIPSHFLGIGPPFLLKTSFKKVFFGKNDLVVNRSGHCR